MNKTNVMRILDLNKIDYQEHQIDSKEALSALDVAKKLNLDYKKVYKTLVTQAKSLNYYVFIIRADQELDLKKAALSTNEKSIEMVKSKELLNITGYIHGGCSPIGMKKIFPTFLDQSALDLNTLVLSGGKIGYFIEIRVEDLLKVINIEIKDLAKNRYYDVTCF